MSDLDKALEKLETSDLSLGESQFTEILKWSGNLHATIVVDRDTQTILRATQGAEEMFGYETESLNNQPLEILLPESVKDLHREHVAQFNSNPKRRSMGKRGMELRGRRRDGTEFRVEISLLPRVFNGRRIVVANLVSLATVGKDDGT